MQYVVTRTENGREKILMTCGFEDKEQFRQVAEFPEYKILYSGKDVTAKYRQKKKMAS